MLQVHPARLERIRTALDRLRFDTLHRSLRPTAYHVLPWPDFHEFGARIAALPPAQQTCFALLTLGKTLALADVHAHLGHPFVDDLREVGLLETVESGAVRTAGYCLLSYQDRYFVVSTNPFYPTARDKQMPIYIGPDSYTLAHDLPLGCPIDSFLDMGTGSGLHAMLMAPFARSVVATDLHPEAAQAARFNAALNGLAGQIEVRQGDLYAPVAGRRFDLIVGDLPYVPAPATAPLPMYADGGEDGMRVLRPLLDGLERHLTPDGQAIFYAASLGDAGGPAIIPYLDDLAQRDGFAVEVLLQSRLTVDDRFLTHVALLGGTQRPGDVVAPEWSALFTRQAAPYVYKLFLYLRRGAPALHTLDLLPRRAAASGGPPTLTLAFAHEEGRALAEDLATAYRAHGFRTQIATYPADVAGEEPHALTIRMDEGTLYSVLTMFVEHYNTWLRAPLLAALRVPRTRPRVSLHLQGSDATAHLKAGDEAELDGAVAHMQGVVKTMEDRNHYEVLENDDEWLLGLEQMAGEARHERGADNVPL